MAVSGARPVKDPAPAGGAAFPEVPVLQDISRLFYDRGWSVGTSSNYSHVLGREPLRLLVTASGKDKRRLAATDFVVVDGEGKPVEPGAARASAETLLHVALAAERPGVGAVLHTHSVWCTLLSDRHFPQGHLTVAGYEMLKGLTGVTTHEHTLTLKIYENTQDIPALSRTLRRDLAAGDPGLAHGFLIRNHGMYTWGRDLDEARRHVEILEFLYEVVARREMAGW